MNTTLIVMAAGLATRYGGDKQIAGMGPQGQILLEYSIYDAIRAGFNKVVFVIRPSMLETMRALCGNRIAQRVEAQYAFQTGDTLPEWFRMPEGREKPLGTVHAVLSAREFVKEPFAVINADDYYGVESFRMMHDFLTQTRDASQVAMVGYRLKNTVSVNGTVTRGVCRVENGRLADVQEVQKIRLYPDGVIADISGGEPGVTLNPDSLVSMNFWGFPAAIFGDMQAMFEDFLRTLRPDDLKGEYPLPVMVDRLLKQGRITVDVLKTAAVWFGVTYQEDRPFVQLALKRLHDEGVYGPEFAGF